MSLKRNTVWNISGAGIPFLLGVVTIPFLIKRVGVESFGILSLVWTMIGYFSIFDFGLGRALTQQVASKKDSGSSAELSSLIKTGLLFILGAGIVGGVVLSVLAYPLGHKWLNVSEALQANTVDALLIAALGIPMTTMTAGLKGVLEAYEDFKNVNLLKMLLGLANFGFPVISVMIFGPSLAMMVLSLILVRFVITIAHGVLLFQRLPKDWMSASFDKEKMSSLLAFGSWMTISNIISPLMVVADRFIISSVIGASLVAYYTVPADFLIRILIIPGALAAALFPRLTSMRVNDTIGAKAVYEKSLKLTALFMVPICLFIAVFSFWGLKIWLGEEFALNSWKITSILSMGLMLNGIAQVPFAAVQAAGEAKVTAYLHLGEFVFYLPLLFVSLHYFGLTGAAIVWVLRVAADLLILLKCANKVHLQKNC